MKYATLTEETIEIEDGVRRDELTISIDLPALLGMTPQKLEYVDFVIEPDGKITLHLEHLRPS